MTSSKLISRHQESQSSPTSAVLAHNGGTSTYVERHRAFSKSANLISRVENEIVLPEVQVIYRSLLIAHVNVKIEQVDWRKSPPAQNLKKSWKPVPMEIGLR
jgi:hypothetical protein